MAGMGERFAQRGYLDPKPLIKVGNVPMIEAVINSLDIDGNYIFIVQKKHYVEYNLFELLNRVAPGCTILQIDGVTDGAARTSLIAKDFINNDTPLVIANSDQIIEWSSKEFVSMLSNKNAIALFEADDAKWSYAQIENGIITEVAEKIVISNYASVGVYGWSSGANYVKYAEQMINKDIKTNNEFYICPVYNEAILDGQTVIPFFVDKMYGVGTPEDLEVYLAKANRT